MYNDHTTDGIAPQAIDPANRAEMRRDRAKRSARKLAIRAALAARHADAIDAAAASASGIDPVTSSEAWEEAGHGAYLLSIVLASLHLFEAEEAWRDAADDAVKVGYYAMAIAGRSGKEAEEHTCHHAEARTQARASFKRAVAAVRAQLHAAPAA